MNRIEKIPGEVNLKILKYLKSIKNGFFIEAGSHDGIFQSNTLILENHGWNGLLVEPSESLFNKCRQNRCCIVDNYALVSFDYKKNSIRADEDGILMKSNDGITIMSSDDDGLCPVITFTELCLKYNIKKVDFFSLDVEGYEMEVLNGIDFNNIDINYILIEINYSTVKLSNLTKYMRSKGYWRVCNISNFTKKNCPSWPGTHQDYLYKKKYKK